MPSVHAKDRVHLCRYTYADHRKCLTPRSPTHPHFCYFHARRESQSIVTAKLADDLSFFFSGRYTSANDLSAALGRLLVAVVRGEIKPGLARTISYMMQTMLQTIQVAQKEYIYAFGTPEWGYEIRNNTNGNFEHLNEPETQSSDSTDDEPETSESSDDANELQAVGTHTETKSPNESAMPNRYDPEPSERSAEPTTPLEATLAEN